MRELNDMTEEFCDAGGENLYKKVRALARTNHRRNIYDPEELVAVLVDAGITSENEFPLPGQLNKREFREWLGNKCGRPISPAMATWFRQRFSEDGFVDNGN